MKKVSLGLFSGRRNKAKMLGRGCLWALSLKLFGHGKEMRRKKVLFVGFVLLCSAILAGCATNTPPVSEHATTIAMQAQESKSEAFNQMIFKAATSREEKTEYRLGPGDVIQVSVFGIPELEKLEGEIDSLGKVLLPLVGEVKVGGLTVPEAQKTLTKAFSKYVVQPKVSVAVKEYHSYRVSVLGEVNKPDVYALKGGRTLMDVLAMAGGLKPKASHTITLVRLGKERTSMIIDLDRLISYGVTPEGSKYNIILEPGDVVYVPKAGSIFVDGYVGHPGAFPLTTNLTVTQALAMAGGMEWEASHTVYVYRMEKGGGRKVVKVNVDEIREGKAKDFPLEVNDVVFVPGSGFKQFVSGFSKFFGFGWTRATGGSSYRLGVGNK